MTRPMATLRQFREERGWTQRDVAENLQRLAWLRHDDHVGVNADMVAKWERGSKGISAYYRELLALLFGVEPRALGLAADAASPPGAEQLQALVVESLELLDRLGPAATMLRAGVLRALREQVVRRRTLLDVMGLLPMAEDDRAGEPAASADLEELADRYQELYHSTDPKVLIAPVIAQFDLADATVAGAESTPAKRHLLVQRARSGILAGRLSFFDLDDPLAARGYYSAALEAAREVHDRHQSASALAHLSFIPAASGSQNAALDYLEGARAELAQDPCGPIESWLAAVASELHANAGDHDAALAAVEAARVAADSTDRAPGWFDFYDDSRLAGFAGYAYLRAGRYNDARRELDDALRLPLAAAKQRAVLHADLATVHFHAGELDEACRVASIAIDELQRAGYATGSERIRAFLALVRPHHASPAVRQLRERASTLS
jgi:transcriptional regulator with XRE-family HTH domain/tetratricopeptide (TPR) repeat protein